MSSDDVRLNGVEMSVALGFENSREYIDELAGRAGAADLFVALFRLRIVLQNAVYREQLVVFLACRAITDGDDKIVLVSKSSGAGIGDRALDQLFDHKIWHLTDGLKSILPRFCQQCV